MVDVRPLQLPPGEVISCVSPEGDSLYFEVSEELGVGGEGVVYACTSDEGTPAVIKGPRKVGVRSPGLEYERRWQSVVKDHPNVVRLLGTHRDPRGHSLLILERVHENPLLRLNRPEVRERIQGKTPGGRYVPLPLPTALEVAYELARGLEHLHRHKVAHCDVKPENLMIRLATPDPEPGDKRYFEALAQGAWRGVLIDLGGARSFKHLSIASAKPDQVELPGLTPIYAPPEVLPGTYDPDLERERSRFSPWIDVYAFGLTLYQLVTGYVPYEHIDTPPDEKDLRSVVETKREERDGAFLPLAKFPLDRLDWGQLELHPTVRGKYAQREQVTERLWELLARAVHYDPVRRGTMKRLRGDLAELAGIAPAPADVREGPVGREWIQRRLTASAAAAGPTSGRCRASTRRSPAGGAHPALSSSQRSSSSGARTRAPRESSGFSEPPRRARVEAHRQAARASRGKVSVVRSVMASSSCPGWRQGGGQSS
jgi:serine/threonine protein kinase